MVGAARQNFFFGCEPPNEASRRNRQFAINCLFAGIFFDHSATFERARWRLRTTIHRERSRPYDISSRTFAIGHVTGKCCSPSSVLRRHGLWSGPFCAWFRNPRENGGLPIDIDANPAGKRQPVSRKAMGNFRIAARNGQRELTRFCKRMAGDTIVFFQARISPNIDSSSSKRSCGDNYRTRLRSCRDQRICGQTAHGCHRTFPGSSLISLTFMRETASNYPTSWAGVVSGKEAH